MRFGSIRQHQMQHVSTHSEVDAVIKLVRIFKKKIKLVRMATRLGAD
jgi:hypothetical protein